MTREDKCMRQMGQNLIERKFKHMTTRTLPKYGGHLNYSDFTFQVAVPE